MKLKLTIIAALFLFASVKLYSQDDKKPGLEVSGSVDTYYKYDFSGSSQIPTYYGEDQNSISIGMVDVSLSQTVGKASFVGEVAVGPRAAESAPGGGPIQNLYVTYNFSDLFSITGGFMATYVGYEVISPVPNFNYSTSYLFSNGPFQNGGIKANFHFSDKFGLMVGVFDHYDWYSNLDPSTGGTHPLSFGAQLSVVPVDGMNIFINLASSDYSGEELDLTATYQATDKFLIGLNAAKRKDGFLLISQSEPGVSPDFAGIAAYLDYSISDPFGLGLRYEYFKDYAGNLNINAITLSGNIKSGPLRLIPEIRMDAGSENIFTDSNGGPVKSATQALIAAVYSF